MSDVTAATIDKILSLAPVERHTFFGLDYSSKPLTLIQPPPISGINVVTLNSLVELYNSSFESLRSEVIVFHVQDEKTVAVYPSISDDYGRRTTFVTATLKDVNSFRFGQWLSQEDFIIALQSNFANSGDRDYVIKLASDIATDDKAQITDNGISQGVTAKSGVLVKEVEVKPRVKLSPYRTFREIKQPESEFVFRIHRTPQGGVQLGLFEADGGEWKLTAMEYIYNYLVENLPALEDTPVAYSVIY